uniref:Uncharacterized protein n=1 Tax=Solanum tuberosum TaxID=4113 RepID=M1DCU5_SOLTU
MTGLEQIDCSKNLIVKDTGYKGTQLETIKERQRGNALELEKEDELAGREADSFSIPKIDKKQPQEIQEKLDTEEEESMDANIYCISREGDLSPRQIGHLKGRYGTHKNNSLGISYVNTKSRRGKAILFDQ